MKFLMKSSMDDYRDSDWQLFQQPLILGRKDTVDYLAEALTTIDTHYPSNQYRVKKLILVLTPTMTWNIDDYYRIYVYQNVDTEELHFVWNIQLDRAFLDELNQRMDDLELSAKELRT